MSGYEVNQSGAFSFGIPVFTFTQPCSPGKVVIAGGYTILSGTAVALANHPAPDNSGWTVSVVGINNSFGQWNVYSVCVNALP